MKSKFHNVLTDRVGPDKLNVHWIGGQVRVTDCRSFAMSFRPRMRSISAIRRLPSPVRQRRRALVQIALPE
ncbi:hypothetical protein CBM2599_B50981 [Cupriavidus taiwanensis]|nr:hypothetical protein CBM2600_B10009 [Cupriavidus taiwanensis]SOY97235.1 hypothetical protein CBM2599_B50981 [Cupriavidus taiwanensis]